MITGIVIGALSAAAFLPQTDTIVQAQGASRIELSSLRGEVVVRTWDRDAVRVVADHPDSYPIEISRSGRTISVEPDIERGYGIADAVDFELTVPKSFDLDIEGMALSVDILGVEGQVEVGTVHGPIKLVGGRGDIVLESVNGPVHLEGAQGDMDVTGIAGGVTIRDCTGDIYAQSVGGELILEGVRSSDVEIGSVGGDVRYEGTIEDGGTYNFGSHGGEILLILPANINAYFEVVSLAGDIELDYPGAPTEATRGSGIPGLSGKEMSFELGTGSARIEVETFGGTVRIQRVGG
jgi:DUF4097 and DUF4098 domain-containing protein YvlB